MLRIDRDQRIFRRLAEPTLTQASILERTDLQEFILNSPDAFFAELGLDLFIVDREFKPSETVGDRIDILALDRDGNMVIVELKRGSHKLQLLQAISYAAMISRWESDELLAKVSWDRKEQLEDFLVDSTEVNGAQRIILIAEGYDYEVLVAAEWLSETYGMDILCARVAVARDETANVEYLNCTPVYPPPELAEQSVARRPGGKAINSSVTWSNWDDALSDIPNDAIVAFFRKQIEAGGEIRLGRKRTIHFRISGRRRWSLDAHNKNAYAWQTGRFERDLEFWQQRLSQSGEVKQVKEGTRLRFLLSTSQDFESFRVGVTEELLNIEWLDPEETADNGDE